VDRPEIKFKVACDVIGSVNFAEFHGIYDVTRNLKKKEKKYRIKINNNNTKTPLVLVQMKPVG